MNSSSIYKIGLLLLATILVAFSLSCASLSSSSMSSMQGGYDFVCTTSHLFPAVFTNIKDYFLAGFIVLVLSVTLNLKSKIPQKVPILPQTIKQTFSFFVQALIIYSTSAFVLVRTTQRRVY